VNTHLDLFSGIGGFALAAKWAGYETIQFVEIEPFCHQVLKKHWPDVPIHSDIKTFDVTKYNGSIDLITGGFPCQPYSVAGKRLGKADDRALWPEMLRIISEIRPAWVIAENVTGILSMGFKQYVIDLEDEGYSVQCFIIPACSVGAPHRRDRVWVVACNTKNSISKRGRGWRDGDSGRLQWLLQTKRSDCDATNAYSTGREERDITAKPDGEGYCSGGIAEGDVADSEKAKRKLSGDSWGWGAGFSNGSSEHWSAVAARLCRVDDGLSRKLDRGKRLKSLGNAIVPQVAYQIINAIPI